MDNGPEYLTVHELAELLRIKERKVYDLAASGQVPVSRATGKLLFPKGEVQAWIDGNRSGPAQRMVRPAVLLGSFDPLLEWAVRQSECGLAMLMDGSADGLDRFVLGEGAAAGMHILDPATDDWNRPAVAAKAGAQDAVLLSFAKRQRGLVLAPDSAIESVGDLKGRRIVARQAASGTATLLAHLLKSAGLDEGDVEFTSPARSELDAVQAVAEGTADATFGLEALAIPFGLTFVPLVEERFDLLVDRRAYFEPPLQALLAFCRTDAFRDRARTIVGYDIGDLERVRWSA